MLSLSTLFLLKSPVLTYNRRSSVLTRHINAVLLVALVVYAIRDVYPLATYSKHPLDLDTHTQGRPLFLETLLWAKIVVLFLTSVVIPLVSPRVWIPVNLSEITADANKLETKLTYLTPNPEQLASPFSLLLFNFLNNVVWKAYRVEHLPAKELPHLADIDHVGWVKQKWFSTLERYSSASDHAQTMTWTLAWMFRWIWIELAVVMLGLVVGNLGSPVAINRLLSYLETESSGTDIQPWVWIVLLFLSPLTTTLTTEWYLRVVLRLSVQFDALVTQLVYEHSLRIRVKADPGSSAASEKDDKVDKNKKGGKSGIKSQTGRINNLVTTDLSNIAELRNWVMTFFGRPVEFLLSVVFLYGILGWSTFVGIGLMIALAPIPAKIVNAGRRLFFERMRRTDLRVQVRTTVMAVLRMVKLFGWEAKMSKRIADARKQELTVLRKRQIYVMLSNLTNYFIPLVFLDLCALQTVIMKQDLTPSRVFSSLVVFERLQTMVRFFFINLNKYHTGLISIERIQEFLAQSELIDNFDRSSVDKRPIMAEDEDHLIGFNNAAFSWNKDDADGFINDSETAPAVTVATDVETAAADSEPTSPKLPHTRKFFLRIEKVVFRHDCVNLIQGPTGSGKTAMLLALLGELHFIPTSQDSWFNLPRGKYAKGVAYAAQESWVLNETIKNNILFHSPYNEERYRQVLYQCALERDLSLFDAGDDTEIGEKGLSISGGQRARLTLARAVYSDAKVLLLDDVLAALDVHTAKWIVEKCFLGSLMKDRTVILVTHNTALTFPIASLVVTMKDGRVTSQEVTRAADVQSEVETIEATASKISDTNSLDVEPATLEDKSADAKKDQGSGGKLVMDEEVQVGHISWAAIKLYATGLGGRFPILFFVTWIATLTVSHLVVVSQTWYLGFWASQYEIKDPGDVPVALYLAGYAGIVLSTVIISACTTMNYIYGTTRASYYVHQRLVASILGTTMRWLDKTPMSRIITRSTQDINSVDVAIVASLREFADVCIRLLSRLGAVLLFSPIFLLPGFFILAIGVVTGSVYFKAQMSVKREMSIAKAPVLGHFGATISGLISIRAYGAQKLSLVQMQTRTDRHSRIARIFNNLQRWMAVRINILSAVFTTSLAWYMVYVLHQSASVTGFSLNMAVSFSSAIFSFILQFNALEARSNSLERIENYLDIEQEPKAADSGTPPAYWPASGDLRVEGLSAKYSLDGPEVLHELSFHCKSGERIGVVGRTGSGKSSLALSLLRGIYTSGDVYYDGLSISKLNLEALRTNITIIPQMPELISGSLRENLDPFEEHDDLTLNDALKSSGLHDLQVDVPDKDRITLDTMVSSGGNNLSLGQRQIIAFARAIVRRSKLLIMDEDYKTDGIIQSSMRNQFTADVTSIIIAHRLQTIIDADRIMVLDAGSIVEFDTPSELLKNPNGHLRTLVDESHDRDTLLEIAGKRKY
ncbi:hypothetical protein BDP27DRAFT_1207896 [Rhodocollybia butyracea]|uniref:P-loop containing nucleoside triphosphate hydrolase protein n=1 Tax=Rhodocollybia butyracea TaxID=206335 RepID=A0A9P5UG55_9AGAR|nr:hypothetical protein BDP27DRAFT_1207896 [Rhodocollybia butyracea]